MQRQTCKYTEWLVLDDGVVPQSPTLGQRYIRCPEYRGRASLAQKLKLAVREATGDAILVIEDDDWYAPDYLQPP